MKPLAVFFSLCRIRISLRDDGNHVMYDIIYIILRSVDFFTSTKTETLWFPLISNFTGSLEYGTCTVQVQVQVVTCTLQSKM